VNVQTGPYPVITLDKPFIGSFTQVFFGGQSPRQYEAPYINPACVRDHGTACRPLLHGHVDGGTRRRLIAERVELLLARTRVRVEHTVTGSQYSPTRSVIVRVAQAFVH
jgi:hypothetical protein